MKRFSVVLVLLAAACGEPNKPAETRSIEVAVPDVDAPVKPEAGFGSGVANDNTVVAADKVAAPVAAVVDPPIAIPASYADCMSLGEQLVAKGDHVHAREVFEAAAKLDRKAALPHVELARSYIDKGERALAIRHAKKAVKLAPESSLAYNTLGRAELLRHDYDGAELAFRQATELDADNVWAWNNLGLVYLTQKNYQEAVNALVEATSRKGVEGYMWNNLGTAYEQLDQLDDARDAFDSGAKLGSVAAKASRKRLDGVDTTRVARKDTPAKEPSFTTREEMPELAPDEVMVDEPHHDDVEPMVEDVPVDDAPVDAAPVADPKVEADGDAKAESGKTI